MRNEDTPASDVDVLVEFREGEETFDHFMDLKYHLEDLLGRKTDLVIADTLKSLIRDSVLREVVCARDSLPCREDIRDAIDAVVLRLNTIGDANISLPGSALAILKLHGERVPGRENPRNARFSILLLHCHNPGLARDGERNSRLAAADLEKGGLNEVKPVNRRGEFSEVPGQKLRSVLFLFPIILKVDEKWYLHAISNLLRYKP